MVDLSQVKMPVVEYEDGRREPLKQFTVDVTGYYVVNGRTYQRDGSPAYIACPHIVAIHTAEPAADGWVKRYEHRYQGWMWTDHMLMKQFGDVTVYLVGTGKTSTDKMPWDCEYDSQSLTTKNPPDWLMSYARSQDDGSFLSTAEIDAAYAAHLEQQRKPVLVWDDSLAFLKIAASGDLRYVVRTITKEKWYAEVYSRNMMSLIGAYFTTEESAKAACERHARGEG